jgi:hypothetical protein
MNYKSRVFFFVLGYLSLSHQILVLIRFSRMQLVARKYCLEQPNDCCISLPTAHADHQAQAYSFPFPAHASGEVAALAGTARGGGFAAAAAPRAIVMAAYPGAVVGCRRRQRRRLYSLTKFEVTSLCHSTRSLHS